MTRASKPHLSTSQPLQTIALTKAACSGTVEASIHRSSEPKLFQSSEMTNIESYQGLVQTLPTQLPEDFLKEITNDFSPDRELGGSIFGKVYKGILADGCLIAVKRLVKDAPVASGRVFDNELTNLMSIQQENIVQLVSFCHEAKKRMVAHNGRYVIVDMIESCLCYKYLHKGSLAQHLYADTWLSIDWDTRFKIIKGICQGLHFLHTELDRPIIHMNLVPDSIWLDDNWVPKIDDFYLPRLCGQEETRKFIVNAKGHIGYNAPEYLNRGEISTMSDIYNLGMLIIEITTGEQYSANVKDRSARKLVDNVQDWKTDELIVSKYPSLDPDGLQQVKECILIALKCVEIDRNMRPSIVDIVKKLNGNHAPIFDQIMELNILERIVAGSEEPSDLDLPLLQKITENFSEKKRIGFGGCGEVYKGMVQNGAVAVKRLFKSRTIKDKMFHREVKNLITVRHNNIVRLLGYCSFTKEHVSSIEGVTIMVDIRERLLCFEYISNGSLERHLTDELRGLEWLTRYEIIVGICKGMLYLHKEKKIIHMDLKPANILLDDHMVPKITDFGLSRLDNNSHTTSTSLLISRGYCAPEYLLEGKSSSKSDIYSLGVIIMEVVTGSKKMTPNITKVLRRWGYRWIKSSDLPALGYQQVKKCLDLAHTCTQHDPTSRPDMSDIMHELNEIDSKEDQFQVIPSLEDMLGIEPLEIQFPFELYWQVSHTVELSNDTDDHFAFLTKPSLHRLRAEPDKGIVPPRSKCSVTITMVQAQFMVLPNNRYKEEITVLSTRVDGGLAAVDITKDMFTEKEGRVVDEVNVVVILGRPPSEEES